jgi:hypothetical protein
VVEEKARLIGLILAIPFTAVLFKAVEIVRRPDDIAAPADTS